MTNYNYDLNFNLDDFETDFRKMEGVFSVAIEGTSLGETVSGKLTGSKKDGQVIQFELEKGNKKIIQLDAEIKMYGLYCKVITKYALLSGQIEGVLLLENNKDGLILKNVDKGTKEKLGMTVKVDHGETMSLDIEGKKNGESMWTFRTRHNS